MKKMAGTCLVLLALTACGTKRGYVEKGNALFQKGKYEDAAINYRKAIQKDSKYGDAYYRLGLDAVKLGNATEAYDALYRASQLLPNNLEVKGQFADFALENYLKDPTRPQRLYQQIQQVSSDFLARNPNSFEGLRLKGYLAYADRKPQEAIAYFRRAIQILPDSAPVTTALVETLNASGQTQEAEKIALNLLPRHKDYGPIYDALARIYSNTNRPADAENALRSKADNNPRNPDYIVELAAHYALSGNTAEMKNALQRMLNDPKNFPNAQMRVGDFYVQQMKYEDAVRYYQEGAQAYPNQRVDYQKRAMAALLAGAKYDDAKRLDDEILRKDPKDEVALRIKADLLINAGGVDNANAALPILQNELNAHPNDDNPSLRFQLGRAYRLKDDLDSARAQFAAAIRMRNDYVAARYELAEISLLQQRSGQALEQAKAILALTPNERRARLLYARSLLASGDATQSRAELTQLLKDSPKDLETRLALGSLAIQQKKFPEAIETLNGVKDSGDPRAFAGLVDAYARAGQIDKAVEVANEGFKRLPNAILIRQQLAISLVMTGRFDPAISEFQKVIAANPKSLENYVRLGAVYDVKGDYTDAIRLFQQAHDLAPNELGPALTLAEGLARAGRRSEATAVYQTILKTHPNDPTALNNTAYFLCDSGGNLDEALKLAQAAVQKAPDQPGFADTLGYVYLKRGMRTAAIQTFNGLVNKYPKYATYRYHLGLAFYESGDKARARKELRDALATHPSRKDVLRINELLARAG